MSNIVLTKTSDMNVVYSRQRMNIQDLNRYLNELYYLINTNGYTINGHPTAIYYDGNINPNDADVEIVVPILEEDYNSKILPGGLCAMVRYVGDISLVHNCYAAINKWITDNNYNIVGAPFEVYITDPFKTKPSDNIIEVYFPIKMN